MEGTLRPGRRVRLARRLIPPALRAHPVLAVVVACVLLGGALRFVPPAVSAAAGGSTACAAR